MNFNLEARDVDQIMNVLMDRPWKESNTLIQKMLSQANDVAFQAKVFSVPPSPVPPVPPPPNA